jgi:hypothetical protein
MNGNGGIGCLLLPSIIDVHLFHRLLTNERPIKNDDPGKGRELHELSRIFSSAPPLVSVQFFHYAQLYGGSNSNFNAWSKGRGEVFGIGVRIHLNAAAQTPRPLYPGHGRVTQAGSKIAVSGALLPNKYIFLGVVIGGRFTLTGQGEGDSQWSQAADEHSDDNKQPTG